MIKINIRPRAVSKSTQIGRITAGFVIGAMLWMALFIALGGTRAEAVEISEIAEPVTRGFEVVEAVEAVQVTAEVRSCEYCHISEWVERTVNGSPIDLSYIDALYRASGEDVYLTELAVAIAFAETTLGTHPLVTQQTNFMGYDAPNGYDPADLNEFAGRLMRGLEYYRGIEANRALATTYTGGDRVDTWLVAVNQALAEMR